VEKHAREYKRTKAYTHLKHLHWSVDNTQLVPKARSLAGTTTKKKKTEDWGKEIGFELSGGLV